jgi:hypothetical protein
MLTSYGLLTVACVYVLRWLRNRKRNRAADWPIAEGHVEKVADAWDTETGVTRVSLAYSYKVDGEWYSGQESFTFDRDDQAASFKAAYRDRAVFVHYRPNKPRISVLSRLPHY